MSDVVLQCIDNAAVNTIFGVMILSFFAVAMILLMFLAVIIRSLFRWLARLTWNDVIMHAARKAFRTRQTPLAGSFGANGGK